MKTPLNEALRAHAESQQLNETQLQELHDLQQQYQPADNPRIHRGWFVATAASLLIVLVAGLVQLYPVNMQQDLIAEIAAEVVGNHLHMKPLEIEGGEIASIRSYFSRLDFEPVQSRYLVESGLVLLGGRYCSLQGVTAAQLRFKNLGSDNLHTLYQVGYDPTIFKSLPNTDEGEQPISVFSNGVKVTIWTEKGLLLALTEAPEMNQRQSKGTE
jgi:hypothetical protein